jgi:ABC-2 type transport system permease protein
MMTLYISELKRRWSLVKAYPGEEVIGTLMLAFFFYMLFLGAKFMAGPTAQFGDRLDAIVVGYVVWLLMMQTYAGIAHDLQSESTSGTLEQLLTTPQGITRIFLMRSLADVSFSFFVTGLVAFVIMLLTGSQLHLSPWMIIPIASVILASTGLGFLVGSLVFLMKQIRSVLMIFQFALLFAVMAPIETWGTLGSVLGSLMPVAPGSAALRTILVQQNPDFLMIGLSVLNAVFYLGLGMWVFKRVEQMAKRRGIVSTY